MKTYRYRRSFPKGFAGRCGNINVSNLRAAQAQGLLIFRVRDAQQKLAIRLVVGTRLKRFGRQYIDLRCPTDR